MTSKTISITEDVYELLNSLKKPGESFSEELERLAKTRGNILDFAGAWSDLPKSTIREMKKNIAKLRNGTRLSLGQ